MCHCIGGGGGEIPHVTVMCNTGANVEMWSILSDLRGGKKSNTPIDTKVLHDHFEKILYSPNKIPKEKLDLIEKKLDGLIKNTSAPTQPTNTHLINQPTSFNPTSPINTSTNIITNRRVQKHHYLRVTIPILLLN